MCGIICLTGSRPATPLLLEGLRRLEYRGYDSSGLAVGFQGAVVRERAVGKIAALEEKLAGREWPGTWGMGHTRWATHGAPSLENAHPHSDCKGGVFVIHNGIIENYLDLKIRLQKKGHAFHSETDTEVLAHLIEEHFDGDLEEAVAGALQLVKGTFGLAIVSPRQPGKIVVARRDSPLILGVREGEMLAASDASALVRHTREVVYLEDDDVAVLWPGGYEIRNLDSSRIFRRPHTLEWDVAQAEKRGYPHFMLKEIHEQPEAAVNAMRGRLVDAEGEARLGGLESVRGRLTAMERLILVSCGTSHYAALAGRYLVEAFTDIPVEVEFASEFRYRSINLTPETVVLAISQSGETADTLAAVREAHRKGALVLGLVNVVGSSIARETDAGIYNHAGPEIAVASTKSFVSQLVILYLLVLFLARRARMSLSEGQSFVRELRSIPDKIRTILDQAPRVQEIASRYARYRNFLYLGRQLSFPIALEGALKLKEISYCHAEAFAAGEMKHGPIAMVDEEFPMVCVSPRDGTYEKMLSNIQEVRARGAPVLAVTSEGCGELAGLAQDVIEVPATQALFSPLLSVVPLQLFAYYVALERGCDIDQPRNLAKSVTVE